MNKNIDKIGIATCKAAVCATLECCGGAKQHFTTNCYRRRAANNDKVYFL